MSYKIGSKNVSHRNPRYCEVCGKRIILKNYTVGIKQWENRKYCSRRCMKKDFKKMEVFKRPHTEETKEKMKRNHPKYWKGKKRPNLINTGSAKAMFKKGENGRLGIKWTDEKRTKLSKAHLKGKESVSTVNEIIRASEKYNNWRKRVYARDNYTCQICGKRDGNICAHHKKPVIDIIRNNNLHTQEDVISCEELWDISNGETLCPKCHRKTENFGYHE